MPSPIQGESYITQQYGLTDFARSSEGKKYYKNFPGGIHPGIDFGTHHVNLPVVATVDGIIVRAKLDGGWGNHVELLGADGWNRQYCHLSMMKVVVGQEVKVGDVLGKVGTTGSSSAIHLHYGNRRRTTFGSWEYRNPSADLKDLPKTAPMPTGKLIKSKNPEDHAVYIYNGRSKFPVPDEGTFVFLFGQNGWGTIEEVNDDILTKIPTGEMIPSLK